MLPPKLVEKLVSVFVISFCKIFIPSYAFDALFLYERSEANPWKNTCFVPFHVFFWKYIEIIIIMNNYILNYIHNESFETIDSW
jgi:hypothetical protein